jgi:hypothetical protein
MIRSWMVYGGVLVLSLGATWSRFTAEETKGEKEGVVLLDEQQAELEAISFASPDLDVRFEVRKDTLGSYGWVTVTDHKQKKAKEGEPPPPVETKVTSFKAGSAGDKLMESMAPLMAMRELVGVDAAKLESFGLNASTTSLSVVAGGRTSTLELGGETYGAKDLYAKHRESSRFYVVDDELIKPLKFATTRLVERALFAYKVEEIDRIELSDGTRKVEWLQHNKEDRSADWWERLPAPGSSDVGKKDETFSNWLEKALKVKSSSYVQVGEEPATTDPVFDLTFAVQGKPAETLHVLRAENDWYAKSDFSRGLVKLTRSVVEDTADEVDDILAGREPAPSEKPAPTALDEAGPDALPAGGPMVPGLGGPRLPGPRPGLPPGIPGGTANPH